MQTAIKTGARVFLSEYGEVAYCDVHQVGDALIFRIVKRTRDYNQNTIFHFIVGKTQCQFNDEPYETHIALTKHCQNLGYDGLLFKDIPVQRSNIYIY